MVLVLSFWPMAARVQDLGQEGPEQGTEVAPVEVARAPLSRFMQVVAQGVVDLSDEVGWRVEKQRALASWRSEAVEADAGFVLAGPEPVILTDKAGNVWQRLGPGAAAWTPPGEMLAVVSTAEQGAPYFEITLADDAAAKVVGEAFSLAAGSYGVDLARGALARTDEASVEASAAPMLLLVTSGSLFAQDAAGAVTEFGTGEPVLLADDTVLSGASRNPAEFVLARIGTLQESPLPLLGMTATPVGAAAATPVAASIATLRVTALLCDAADGEVGACDAPAAGLPLMARFDDGTTLTRTTNRQGEAGFDGAPAGKATLEARLPGGAVTRSMTCDPVEPVGTDEVALTIEAGQDVACTWLLGPREGEDAVRTSLEVDIRACPEGMTLERLTPGACEPAGPGTWLTLAERDGSVPLGVGEALAERWRWDRLDPGSYALSVDAVPEGFVSFSLGKTPLAEGEATFPVRIPAGFVMREETLFLFPPDVPRTQSLTIETWACPPGMSGETLVPELCAPLVEEADLVLHERGAEVPPFAAQDGIWVWDELGALPYDLEIAALPDGFSGGQLDDDCCEDESLFFLGLSDTEPETRRVLYLWRPFDEDSERDADSDGLPDVREVESGTNAFLADSDGDGLGDQDEVDFYGTDPLLADTDDDGLSDADEATVTFTNPFLADSDGDGVDDADEIAAGTDPLEVLSLPGTPEPPPEVPATPTLAEDETPAPSATVEPTSTPAPGSAPTPVPIATLLAEGEAISPATPAATSGGSSIPASRTPAASDTSPEFALDGDGLTTLDELAVYNTDPTRADSDGDGVNDGDEVVAGTDPRDPDDR